jgi:hypothetical protein
VRSNCRYIDTGAAGVSGIDAPAPTAYDSVGYQTALSQAFAAVKTILQRRQLDPLRYIVEIDAGLPVFATREVHQLRIAYNRHQELSMEVRIPHRWMIEQTGKVHEDFLIAVDDMVLTLKGRIQAAGRAI